MPFKPGQSGNPGGSSKAQRNRDVNALELAKKYTVEAIETLAKIMRKPRAAPAARIAAALGILRKTLPDLSHSDVTYSEKKNAADFTREELLAILNAPASSEGIAGSDGRGDEPNQVH
jgi:hypothetical protein